MTDRIYPYPHAAVGKQFHKLYMYRECWQEPWWNKAENRQADYVMRFFWTYIFYMACEHPEAYLGHFPSSSIDPSKWTDEELGIPPLDEGSYKDWYKENRIDKQPDDE